MIKIRLSRMGRIKKPIFTIVATNSRSPRDSKYLEKLGQYDPKNAKEPLKYLNVEGIKGWIAKGAIVSDTVETILKKNSIKLTK